MKSALLHDIVSYFHLNMGLWKKIIIFEFIKKKTYVDWGKEKVCNSYLESKYFFLASVKGEKIINFPKMNSNLRIQAALMSDLSCRK